MSTCSGRSPRVSVVMSVYNGWRHPYELLGDAGTGFVFFDRWNLPICYE